MMSKAIVSVFAIGFFSIFAQAQQPSTQPVKTQSQLDAELIKMLSGATLEGHFNTTGPGRDPTQFTRDKYTLGQVRRLTGKLWVLPTRIQYGEKDVTVPITLPIEWAGDTPVVVVDDMSFAGMGPFSARVMFFDGHYSGFWKHADVGGNMFGVIKPATQPATAPTAP